MKTIAEKKLMTILISKFLQQIRTQAKSAMKNIMFEGKDLNKQDVYERMFDNDLILDTETEIIVEVINQHFWEWRDEIEFDIQLAEDLQQTDNSMKGKI